MQMTPLFEKIRDARCLELAEMEVLAAALDELEARRSIDALDLQWSWDMAKFIEQRRARGGQTYLTIDTRRDCLGRVIVGLCMVAFGLYMLGQFLLGPDHAYLLPELFFGTILVMGIWVIRGSMRSWKAAIQYEQGRAEYAAGRTLLCQHLPPESQSRRRFRFCPTCLNSDL